MTSLVLIVAVGAAVAGFVQGLAGFAFGLVAMALWAWTLEPALAGPLVVFGSLVGQLIAARAVMRDLGRTHAWPFVIGGVAGVPLGVMLLHYINPLAFKAAVGLLLVVWCPLMMRAATLPRLRWGGIWADAGAGWVGGVMGGLGGLTGPAPVLWTTLRGQTTSVRPRTAASACTVLPRPMSSASTAPRPASRRKESQLTPVRW